MDLQQFSDALSSTGFSQSIQMASWAIPAIQTVHILALSLVMAAALVLALRVMGNGLVEEPLPRLAARFTRLIWWLLLVLFASGALLISAEPHRTLTNPVFYTKMVLLVAVSLLTLWLAAVAKRDPARPPIVLRLAAVASLLMWTGIIFAGRLIAYYDPFSFQDP